MFEGIFQNRNTVRWSVIACCYAFAGLATAEPIDVIVLKNGDRITGEISQIWDAEVTIEPAYASDPFNVDIEAIAYIESERDFEIALEGGREVVGKLAGVDDDGNQLIVADGTTTAVPLIALQELEEPEEYFDWIAHTDVAVSIDKGNTDKEDVKISADGEVKLGDHRHFGDISFIREEQEGVSTKEQDLARYNYNWLFNDPWYLSGVLSYESDPIRELDYRYIAGAGVGRDIFNTPRLFLTIQAGLGYQTEKIGGENEDNAIATWLLRYRQDLFDTDLEVYHKDSINTNISGRSNTVIKTIQGLRYDFNDLLYANLELIYDYETDPAPGNEKDDLSLLIGIGAEFE